MDAPPVNCRWAYHARMGRALLINPSYARTYGSNEGGLAFPVYPVLSLATLAGAARDAGHEVEILDLSYRRYDPRLVEERVRAFRPDLVGVTATTPLANQMRDISYLVKAIDPSILALGGGPHPTALPELTLAQSALDVVAMGEADFLVAQLLDGSVSAGSSPVVLPAAGSRGLLEDLDGLPMPAWDIYPRESNAKMSRLAARHTPVTTIEFSRGCVYSCDFCGSKSTMGRGYRKKSPQRCAEEMVRLARLGFREAVVVDDIFTSDREWAAEVCEELIRVGSPLGWSCTNGIRVDSADDELFALMNRAGCFRVYFGLESGNDEILRSFGKGGRASLEQARRAIASSRRAGLEPNGFFLVGLSGDDERSMADTIEFAKGLDLDAAKCGICVPFPGTPMFDSLEKAGRIRTRDWDQYTVYNDAEQIFEHPGLDHETINRAFKRFYREVYLRNPRYVVRRSWSLLRSGELFWTAWYAVRFLALVLRRGRAEPEEPYAFESRWRPLDRLAENLPSPVVVRARKGGGPTGRDGHVSVVSPARRSGSATRR